MRAAQIIPGSDGGKLAIVDDVPDPSPGSDQVLIRVHTSGLNRGEVRQVGNAKSGDPRGIGVEFAGVVEEVGAGVTDLAPGDRVMGHGTGGQAELVVAARRALMRIPDGISWTRAGAFPNVFTTAHDALVTNAGIQRGETMLVNAASSGIGLASIRIAKVLADATVIATTRTPGKAAALLAAGADHVIVTDEENQVDRVNELTDGRGVDVVIDSVGGTVFADNLNSMAVQGRLVNIGRLGSAEATIDLNVLWFKRLHLIGVTFQTRSEEERLQCVEACARDLLEHLPSGDLDLPIDRVFPLTELQDAHDYIECDAHVGKIVIEVVGDDVGGD